MAAKCLAFLHPTTVMKQKLETILVWTCRVSHIQMLHHKHFELHWGRAFTLTFDKIGLLERIKDLWTEVCKKCRLSDADCVRLISVWWEVLLPGYLLLSIDTSTSTLFILSSHLFTITNLNSKALYFPWQADPMMSCVSVTSWREERKVVWL